MERLEKREWLALVGLFVAIGLLLSYLPFSGTSTFLSPDETAVFVAAKNLAEKGTIVIEDKLATSIPWLHPRSWVSHGPTIVPVGFLGWPWIISWFIRFFGSMSASVGAMLVILSCIYPLYRLMRPIGKVPAFIGTVVAVTSPAFLLYGNRSLFSNAAILSLALWSAWMFRDLVILANAGIQRSKSNECSDVPVLDARLHGNDRQHRVLYVLFGLLSGLTLAIRPVEAVWIIPWFIVLGFHWRPTLKQFLWIVLGVFIALAPLAWQAQIAYGGFWKAGYWMQGNSLITTTDPIPQNTYTPELFPFGIHPRAIFRNARAFLGVMLFPWMVPLLMAFFLYVAKVFEEIRGVIPAKAGIQNRLKSVISIFTGAGSPRSRGRQYVLAGLWTFFFFVMYYGNGLYLDNINVGAVTIGNSYIRYLMPIGFVSALAVAWIFRLSGISRYGRPAVIAIAVLLVFTGIWRAYAADEEGLLVGRGELVRYATIRESVSQWFKPGDVILSERSDKIFFPVYRAVSPLPLIDEASQLSAVVEQGIAIGLFVRPMSQSQADLWRKIGLEPVDLATFGREKLYRLQPIQP